MQAEGKCTKLCRHKQQQLDLGEVQRRQMRERRQRREGATD